MSEDKEDPENPEFVTKEACLATVRNITEDVGMLKLAMFGKNGRGGLVKDIADIKSAMHSWISFIKPIAVGVFTGVIVYIIASVI